MFFSFFFFLSFNFETGYPGYRRGTGERTGKGESGNGAKIEMHRGERYKWDEREEEEEEVEPTKRCIEITGRLD